MGRNVTLSSDSAAKGKHDADERDDERKLRQQHQRTQLPDDVQEGGEQDDKRAGPRWLADTCPQRVAPCPQQPGRDDGN